MILGVVSLAAVAVSHLALTDIYHGEQDVTLEWTALRVCFGVIVAFHIYTLATLRRFVRGDAGGEQE